MDLFTSVCLVCILVSSLPFGLFDLPKLAMTTRLWIWTTLALSFVFFFLVRHDGGTTRTESSSFRSSPFQQHNSEAVESQMQQQRDWKHCKALASQLSRHYRQKLTLKDQNDEDDDISTTAAPSSSSSSSTSLTKYLAQSGILLTMCLQDLHCGASFQEDHLAASWIQKEATGSHARFYGNLGLVLNATVLHDKNAVVHGANHEGGGGILCAYPADGDTDQRRQRGCGSVKFAPNWLARWVDRSSFVSSKNKIFGKNRTWSSIGCVEFYLAMLNNNETSGDIPDIQFGTILWNADKCPNPLSSRNCTPSNYTYQTVWPVYQMQIKAILGSNTTCYLRPQDERVDSFNSTNWFIYDGLRSWPPTIPAWRDMLQIMKQMHQAHPLVALWNEVVIRKPRRGRRRNEGYSYRDLVQAIFVTEPSSTWRARLEALALGHKHVLRMRDLKNNNEEESDEDLFECAIAASSLSLPIDGSSCIPSK